MPKDAAEIGSFVLGIRLLRYSDGKMEWQTHSVRKDLLIEIVITRLRAFLRNMEEGYFEAYDTEVSKSKKG